MATPTKEKIADSAGLSPHHGERDRASAIREAMRPAFLVYVLLSLLAISFVPKLVPSEPSASDSYLFGYNNRAGIILLLLLVAVGVIWTRGLRCLR